MLLELLLIAVSLTMNFVISVALASNTVISFLKDQLVNKV